MLDDLRNDVHVLTRPEKANILQRFFKTGKGEYGEGDIFLGLTVPECRTLAKKYSHMSWKDIETLVASKNHEERLIALLILVQKFQTGSNALQQEVYAFYLEHTKHINNWDLVDLSAAKIVGEWVYLHKDKEYTALKHLARSDKLWERRIAIIATFAFILHGSCEETFFIAEILLKDTHDLIQKAVGWMLREAGKRISEEKEESFLRKHYKEMGRTALRYAIERFPEEKRKVYLSGSF